MNIIDIDYEWFDENIVETDIEQCGIVLGRKGPDGTIYVEEFVPVHNSAEDPKRDYRIRAGDVHIDHLPRIVGSWHTHFRRDGDSPSYRDVRGCPDENFGLVYNTATKNIALYNNEGFITWVRHR